MSEAKASVAVLVPAAGRGMRLGGARKQFRQLGDAPLLVQTLRVFEAHPDVDHLVVAGPPGEAAALEATLRAAGLEKLAGVVRGGATRQASVAAALAAAPPEVGVVLVHDAVRPFVRAGHIAAVVAAVREQGAAALAVPMTDTVRRADNGRFGPTVPRAGLFRMQTPQGFRRDLLAHAHAEARRHGRRATDDVDLVQLAGHPVALVEGEAGNFKITTPADWALARLVWAARAAGDL